MTGTPTRSFQGFTPPSSDSGFLVPDRTMSAIQSDHKAITAYERALDAKDDLIEFLRTQNSALQDKHTDLLRENESLKLQRHNLTEELNEKGGPNHDLRVSCEVAEHKLKEMKEKCNGPEKVAQKGTEEGAADEAKLCDTFKRFEDFKGQRDKIAQDLDDIRIDFLALKQKAPEITGHVSTNHYSPVNGDEASRATDSAHIDPLIAELKMSVDDLLASRALADDLGVLDPEVFSGDRNAFKLWLTRLAFKVKSNKMTDSDALSYTLSRTADTTLDILEWCARKGRFDTFEGAIEVLRRIYVHDGDSKGRVSKQFLKMQQQDDQAFDDFYGDWLMCVETLEGVEHVSFKTKDLLRYRLNARLEIMFREISRCSSPGITLRQMAASLQDYEARRDRRKTQV